MTFGHDTISLARDEWAILISKDRSSLCKAMTKSQVQVSWLESNHQALMEVKEDENASGSKVRFLKVVLADLQCVTGVLKSAS